jgi:hypothetical protein
VITLLLVVGVVAYKTYSPQSIQDITHTGDIQTTGIDLTNCISYFDGCNNCSVKDGKPDACTLMYCETPSETYCKQYQHTKKNDNYLIQSTDRMGMPGEDISIYTLSGKHLFSLTDQEIPQYVRQLIGKYLLIDIGTSSSRSFALYDISTQQQLLST